MSYTALYRKYRPNTFEDVKGQDHIVRTLMNQIRTDRIGHAYLFCGTRGTGKTTVAKIFAKAVNCQNPTEYGPCCQCSTCKSIASGASMNVIEIDAASNNGVDNIRQIIEEVNYMPPDGRYKVYIIDEVHMLSSGAFNALLKTLEEPPTYVIFILATTEPYRLPITILSRCQRYDFHHITSDVIAGRLTELMEEEGTQVQPQAIRYIAKAADGSMRDALSLLDQCISFYIDEELTYENTLEILGTVDTGVLSELFTAIMDADVSGGMLVVEKIVRQGRDLGQFVVDFLWYLRNLLLVEETDEPEDLIDISAESLTALKTDAQMADLFTLMHLIRECSDLSNEMKYSSQKRILLEVSIVKLCRPTMKDVELGVLQRIKQLEKKMEVGIFPKESEPVTENYKPEEVSPKELLKAVPEDIRQIIKEWYGIIKELPSMLREYLKRAHLTLGKENQLRIVFSEEVAYIFVEEEERVQMLERKIEEKTGKKVEIVIQFNRKKQSFEENYIDLQKLINMEIDYEDA